MMVLVLVLTMRNAGGHEIHIPLMTLASHGIQKDVYVLYKFCDCFFLLLARSCFALGLRCTQRNFICYCLHSNCIWSKLQHDPLQLLWKYLLGVFYLTSGKSL